MLITNTTFVIHVLMFQCVLPGRAAITFDIDSDDFVADVRCTVAEALQIESDSLKLLNASMVELQDSEIKVLG